MRTMSLALLAVIATAALMVWVMPASAAEPKSATAGEIPNVEGTWSGTWSGEMNHGMTMVVRAQNGATFTGNITYTVSRDTFPMKGSIGALSDDTVTLDVQLTGFQRHRFKLTMTGGTRLSGQGTSARHSGPVTLTRVQPQ